MRKTKIFATLLTFIMVLCLGNSFAAQLPDVNSVVITEAVTDLNELKIMIGDENGDFRGEANVTRAEFATIICRILGYESSAQQLQDLPSYFTDTNGHWANGYINTAHNVGILNGFEDNSFRPDDNVTIAQAIKMLVCSLGYEENTFKYPDSYVMKGKDIKLYNNISNSFEEVIVAQDEAATRNIVAVLIHNAIDIPLRVQTSWSTSGATYSTLDGEELMTLRIRNYAQYTTKIDETFSIIKEETEQITGIYVTPTGKRYHYLASCAGKNAIETTLEKAISQGKTPCKTCVE